MGDEDDRKEKSKGFGWPATLAIAGGAAAIGYLASSLWNDWQAQNATYGTGGGGPPPRPQPPPSANDSWKSMKKNRSKVCDTKEIPEEMRCIVCMENPRETILLPCNHVCLCIDCADKITRGCPVCNRPIQSKTRAFIP